MGAGDHGMIAPRANLRTKRLAPAHQGDGTRMSVCDWLMLPFSFRDSPTVGNARSIRRRPSNRDSTGRFADRVTPPGRHRAMGPVSDGFGLGSPRRPMVHDRLRPRRPDRRAPREPSWAARAADLRTSTSRCPPPSDGRSPIGSASQTVGTSPLGREA